MSTETAEKITGLLSRASRYLSGIETRTVDEGERLEFARAQILAALDLLRAEESS